MEAVQLGDFILNLVSFAFGGLLGVGVLHAVKQMKLKKKKDEPEAEQEPDSGGEEGTPIDGQD